MRYKLSELFHLTNSLCFKRNEEIFLHLMKSQFNKNIEVQSHNGLISVFHLCLLTSPLFVELLRISSDLSFTCINVNRSSWYSTGQFLLLVLLLGGIFFLAKMARLSCPLILYYHLLIGCKLRNQLDSVECSC